MSKLQGKVAVITGGTSGIGKATAQEFIREGAKVIITGRNQTTVAETVKELGANAYGIVSDAAKMTDIRQLAGHVKAIAPTIDIIFANAGYGKFAPVEFVDEAHFDEQFNVLVKGTYFTVQQLLPLLSDSGSIVLNTSVVTEVGMQGASVYSAAKAAVQSLTKTFAAELAGRGIRVNAVSPGPIQTAFFDKTGLTEEQIHGFASNVLSKVPLNRFGQPTEIAKAVVFLASGDASYMHGTEMFVDGGMVQI
ncbi:MAG: SDR family oxidoreductase [Cytophagales bacterium]|nr:SDR family oxidoreductase [Cytophagales bacterium]